MSDYDEEPTINTLMAERFRTYLPVVIDVETGGFNAATDAILEVAAVVGRENVIAGVDCGLSTSAASDTVEPRIAWAKLGSLVEGAKRATATLWG